MADFQVVLPEEDQQSEFQVVLPEDTPTPTSTPYTESGLTGAGWPAGGKYTPEQMRALDQGRRDLLNQELDQSVSSGDTTNEAILRKEIAYNKDSLGQQEPRFIPVSSRSAQPKEFEVVGLDEQSVSDSSETANTGNYAMNRLTQGLASIPSTALTALGTVSNFMAPNMLPGDTHIQWANEIEKKAKESWAVTEEQQKNATFGQKALGAGAQLVGTLPAMVLGPIMGPVAMAAIPTIQTGKELVDAGVDPNRAATVAAASGTAMALLMKVGTAFPSAAGDALPKVLQKYLLSAGATGGVNVAQGMLERKSINEYLKESDPDVARLYNWADHEQGIIEFGLGAILGPFSKFVEDKSKKSMLNTFELMKKDRELHQQFHNDVIDLTVQDINYSASPETTRANWTYRFDQMDPTDAKNTFEGIEKQFSTPFRDYATESADHNQVVAMKLDNYLGGVKHTDIFKDPDNVDLLVTLKALERLGAEMNFSNINVNIKSGQKVDFGGFFQWGVTDTRNQAGDRIILPQATGRKAAETIVHEVGHAVTSRIIHAFEKGNIPKGMEHLKGQYDILKANWDKARDAAAVELVKQLPLADQVAMEPLKGNTDAIIRELRVMHGMDLYGLKNIYEGVAALFESVDGNKHTGPIGNQRGLNIFDKLPKDGYTGTTWKPVSQSQWTDVWKAASNFLSDTSGSNFLKSFYSQVFGLADGAREAYVNRDTMKAMAKMVSEEEMHKIIQISSILEHSASRTEALDRIRALSNAPSWHMILNENPDLILWNPAKIKAQAEAYLAEINERLVQSGSTKEYGKPGSGWIERGELFSPYKDIDQYMAVHGNDLIGAKDFTRPLLDKALGPDQLKMMDRKNPLTRFMNFVFKLQQDYNGMEAKMFYDIMSHALLFKKLSETDQTAVMNFAAHVDDNKTLRSTMGKAGKYWMDKVEIDQYAAQHGLKLTEQAKWAYWDMGHSIGRTWDLLDSIRAKQGLDPVKRIPNYMPHMWKGSYKVFVEQEVMRDGKMRKETVVMRGFNFKQEAQIYADRMRAKGYDIKPNNTDLYKGKDWHVVQLRDFDQGLVPTLMQNMEAYRAFELLDPQAQAKLAAIDGESIIGFTSHTLDQTGVSGFINDPMKKGYDTRDILFGQRRRDHIDTLNLYENYVKQVVEHYKNVMYYHDVHKKITSNAHDPAIDKNSYYTTTMARFPNFNKFLDAQVRNYTGEAVNAFKDFDQALIRGSIAIGIPPYLYRQGIKSVRNLMSIVFTRYNPGNWAMNYIQPVHTFGILSWIDSRRRLDGLSHADLSSVIMEVKNKFNANNKELGLALHWARSEHILDAQAEYQVRSKEAKTKAGRAFQKVNLSEVPTKIESSARETSFALAYTYFKRVLGDPVLAREAATEAMGTTMVNYDRSRRPLMYQSYGVIGEMLSPFAVFRNAYAGNMTMLIKHALSNPKEFHAWKPFLVANSMFMLTAGVVGSVGFSEYDAIVRLLKKFAPETFGEMSESGVALTKLGVLQVVRLGALAAMTSQIPGFKEGAAISGSGAVVSADDLFDPNIVPFATALEGIVKMGAKYATGRDVTASEKYEALTGVVPGQMKLGLDWMFQESGSDTSFAAKKLTGSTSRTFADNMALGISGKPSIKESEEKGIIRELKNIEVTHREGVKKLVEMAVDSLAGSNTETLDNIYTRAFELYGVDPEKFDQMIFDKRVERMVPAISRMLEGSEDTMLTEKLVDALSKFRKGQQK